MATHTNDDPALAALYSQREAAITRLARIDAAIAAMLGEPTRAASPVRPTPSRPVRSATARSHAATRQKKRGAFSWVAETTQVLREHRQPMHWSDIMEALKKKGLPMPERRKARDTISGILTRLAREGREVEHVGPGMFGLLEWRTGKTGSDSIQQSLPIAPQRAESEMTLALVDIVSRNPGKTPSEIVALYESEIGEEPEVAKSKRESRKTRVSQLAQRGRLRREEGRYYAVQ